MSRRRLHGMERHRGAERPAEHTLQVPIEADGLSLVREFKTDGHAQPMGSGRGRPRSQTHSKGEPWKRTPSCPFAFAHPKGRRAFGRAMGGYSEARALPVVPAVPGLLRSTTGLACTCAPPAGPGKDVESIVTTLEAFADERRIPSRLRGAFVQNSRLWARRLAPTMCCSPRTRDAAASGKRASKSPSRNLVRDHPMSGCGCAV